MSKPVVKQVWIFLYTKPSPSLATFSQASYHGHLFASWFPIPVVSRRESTGLAGENNLISLTR